MELTRSLGLQSPIRVASFEDCISTLQILKRGSGIKYPNHLSTEMKLFHVGKMAVSLLLPLSDCISAGSLETMKGC